MIRQPDGRKARGDRRRQELIEATLRVIERDGVAGVTHRTVAREAGVPTTSTTYHFSSLEDLLTATLTWCAGGFTTAVRDLVERARIRGSQGAREVAEMIVEALGPQRGRTMAEYELYLFASRRPALRPAARLWLDVLTSLVQHDDEVAFRAFLAGMDGLLMQGLIDDEPPTVAELEPVVAYLMRPSKP
ncbi:TetR family transcriptional regulator [Actinosynnema sp. ALI-1.44]|uniref:TetR/AcrR family transcriptional regulator n=1 Tax=Actinosynnema sp. ALI-1.44 TaxID=1933779 RepID=UPI00097C8836|nr:TetR family transcriptional regulator [Actinosynnema sp. ALI-1.44]ONI73489.1 TetR family transcriptional regulator [Actinosynnema sp. ALI-1.44]